MYESIRNYLIDHSIEHWKLVVQKRDIVNAHFPAEAGQDNSSLQKTVQEEDYHLHLYREFHRSGRKFCGHTSVEWDSSTPRVDIERQILDAWQEALHQEEPWFPLKIDRSDAIAKADSSFSKQPLHEWILPLQEALVRATEGKPYFLQNEFIRLCREERIYLDSFGLEMVDVNYEGIVDISILPRDNPHAHPLDGEIRFSEFVPHVLALYVQEKGELACDGLKAEPLPDESDVAIVVRGPLVAEILQYVVRQLSGLSLYAGLSKTAPGQWLWDRPPTGDPLTVRALPNLYNSPNNHLFDDQGLVLASHTLVQDGVVKSILTSQETAHYLGFPLTGMNGNFSVTPGTLDLESLNRSKTIEILRFRTFDLEESTGRFSAEVDFAYRYDAGHKSSVYGFSLAGNLQELLTSCSLSTEIWTWENYEGPEFILLPSSFLVRG